MNAPAKIVRMSWTPRAFASLAAIAKLTGDPEASVSARLRDFRKLRFGGHTVERRYVEVGLFEYRVLTAKAILDKHRTKRYDHDVLVHRRERRRSKLAPRL